MKFTKSLTLVFLTSCGVLYPLLSVQADIQTTTVKTTTFSSGDSTSPVLEKQSTVTTTTQPLTGEVRSIVLPATSTYIIVDPLTGAVKGNFDPLHGVVDVTTIVPGAIVIDQVTGKIVATVSPSGQTIDVVSAPALVPLVTAIDSRRTEIDSMITSSLSAGTIDPTQATALRAELDKIATQETLDKQTSGVLTYSEALSLALALNNLSDRGVLLAHGTTITPLLGTRIVSANGDLVMVDTITYRRIKLGQRIDDEYTAGRLSARQVSDLKEQLNTVASLDSKYRKNGQLSESKSAKLATKLDNIESRMNNDIAIINDKRAKIGIKVQ